MSTKTLTTGTVAGIAMVVIGAAVGTFAQPKGTPLHLEVRDAISGRAVTGPLTVEFPEGVATPLATVVRGPRVFLRYESEAPPAIRIVTEAQGSVTLDGVPEEVDPVGLRTLRAEKSLLQRFK